MPGQRGRPVGPFVEALALLFMASLAGLSAYILRRVGLIVVHLLLAGRFAGSVLFFFFLVRILLASVFGLFTFTGVLLLLCSSDAKEHQRKRNDYHPPPFRHFLCVHQPSPRILELAVRDIFALSPQPLL